ncbi:MAG: amino acid adenylation domain-containing protein [Bacteroidaceae bacterium]|nr:amino acid adenylation domain-containing protein [Bacteroidaceae bacterium]
MDYSASALSCAQQGVYIDCILHPDKLNYNIPYSLTFSNLVSPQKLAEATSYVLSCHPTLYSVFESREEKVVQVYRNELSIQVNIRTVTADEVSTAKAAFVRSFDIDRGPLCRAEVLATLAETILLIDIHHLVCDGTSMNLLLHEICASLEGNAPAEEQQGYAAFAEAQHDNTADHKAYYDQLLNEAEPTSLPTDLNRGEGCHKEIVWQVCADNVMERAKAMGTAPSALFMSAAFYTLARYANTKSVCMTTISNGRQNPLTKGVVGMFVNTIPLVSKLEDVSVKEYILKNREMFVETRQHEEYPFGNLVNDYGIEQKARFTYQYGTYKPLTVDGKDVKRERLRTNDHENPFTVTINEVDCKPAIIINYDSALYSETMISRFAESMDAVVSHFIDNPEARLLSVSIMSVPQEEELKDLRQTCLDPHAVRFPLFHNSIEHWAEQTPDATALIACNETLTYRQFNEKANILAHTLINKGVVPGDRICLLLPRKSWHLIAMFGVMKAGAAYIPCDPEYPAERINLITEDSHARYVITTADKMADYGERALNIEDILAEDKPKTNPAIAQDSDSLAYLIYTSGSTGRPKGVMLRHMGICNYLTPHKENRHIYAFVNECNAMMGITTVSFDLSLKELGATLYNGKTLVLANEEEIMSPILMADLYRRTGCDGFNGTPSRLKMFLELPEFQEVIKDVKVIILGGEKYPATLIPQLRSLTKARLFNTYGPTEITVSSNVGELTSEEKVTVGEPLLNYKEYVVDVDDNELPVGVVGELLIGGLAVGRGYNDLPEKTAEAFIEYQGERVYRSGDFARWLSNGKIEILGRKDHQIKLNGLRIELGEVETVLNKQPQVKEGVVMIKNVKGHDHLVAYYTSNESVDENTLKEQMATSLTDYMVPTIFMQLDKMPISPNGKTDLKALPEPVMNDEDTDDATPRELNFLEKKLSDLVSGILETDNVSITSPLRRSGLTSLLSIKLAAQLYKEFGIKFKVKELASGSIMDIENVVLAQTFENPSTSSGQSLNALRSDNNNHSGEKSSLTSAPLSYSQLGVFTECMNHPEDVQYNLPNCLTMPQGVTSLQVTDALKKIFEAHPYLNTHLVNDDNGDTYQCPMQEEMQIPVLQMSEDELEQEKASFVRPFHLIGGPLYRMEIVETPSGVHLLLDFHHLIMDGGSLDIFYNQLCKALDGESLEKEGYDYYQFVADQKIESKTEDFFASQLGQIEDASAFLPDEYNANDDHAEARVRCATDLNAVELKCHALDITPASLYLAAFMMAVSKYTAEETVGICTISNGRSNVLVSDSFGMFVNTLPLITKVDPELTVDDYLLQVSRTFSQTLDNENYPFAKIAEKYGYAPNIMYAYQVGVINAYSCSKGALQLQRLHLQRAKFPVAVFVSGSKGQGGFIEVTYDASLFSQGMMQGLADAVQNIVGGILTKKHIKDIEVCDEQMIATLDTFNAHTNDNDDDNPSTSSGQAQDETVLSLFLKAAKLYPDHVAAVFKEKQYTYKQLDELTDKIGALIYNKVKDCGKQEPVVSILIPRNEYMFILPLSAMKAGCAYQPLDPSYPQERLNFMVKDADAALLIADSELKDIVNEYEGEVLLTDSIIEEASAFANSHPSSLHHREGWGGSSLFILLYTSGSTGVPKGVMLEHQNLVAFIKWYRRYYDLKPKHNVAAYASFGFDANMMDMYPALTTGATLHIVAEELRLDLVALNEYFEQNNITHSFITTQVGVQFLQNTENHSLKHLSVGGEKLVSVDPAEGYTFHNGYGPTECTIFTTTLPVLKKEPNIPIGKPTDELECYVMDKNLHRLPVGAAGELVIVGKQVGRGYLNRPDKTAEVFFTYNGKRAYHSGDIVRYREDGNIEFVGRKDGQVKIRGFRIELKEAEAVIRDFEGINDVTVQAFDDPNGGKFIAAYIVSDKEVNIKELNQFILDQKPPYMVPAVTIQIPEIPLNVNQKVDKKALPKPEVKQKAASDAPAAPLNALETELKEIIASVVNTDEFSITDILGYVGLTSISSIKLATLIYKRFGIQVNSKTLAKAGSLQSIENEILNNWMKGEVIRSSNAEESQNLKTSKHQNLTTAPLSFTQQGVYTDCMANAGGIQYNIPYVLTFSEGVTVQRLQDALKQVIAAHPYMMCHFITNGNGDIVQQPIQNFELTIPVAKMSVAECEEHKKTFVKPFDINKGPLFRFEICEVESQVVLFADVHHLISDGFSVNMLYHQLCQALDGQTVSKEAYDYYDFVHDQTLDEAADEYFDQTIGGVEEVSRLLPDIFKEGLHHHQCTVSAIVPSCGIDALCRQQGITPAAFFLAASALTVSRYLCEEDITMITISNGRSNLKIYDTMGMFVNTLPLALHVGTADTIETLLKHVSSVFDAAIDHESYPFARVAKKYDFMPQISYACQMGVIDQLQTKEGMVKMDNLDLDIAKVPVAIYVNGSFEDGLTLVVNYDSSLYTDKMMQHFVDAIANAAGMLAEKQSVKEVSLTTEKEWTLLDSFNSPLFTDYDHSDSVVSLFRKKVASHPDKMAAVFGDKRYTYRELDEATDRLSHIIYSKVTAITCKTDLKEQVVSIIIDRNEWVFLLPLAVLKTGCAYEPLDPSYPSDRLNYMVQDAKVSLLIGQEELIGQVSEYKGEVVTTSELEKILLNDNDDNNCLSIEPSPSDLLLMLYTSGSTGKPKGVQIEHHSLVSFAYGISKADFYAEDCVAAAYASFGFDVCMMDTFCTLLNGGTLVIIPEDMRLELKALSEYMESEHVTQIFMTTQVGVQFLQNYPNVKHLRYLGMGGEKLPAVNPEGLSYKILNGYGPTENTCGVSLFPIKHWESNIPLGRPFPTIQGYVLDKAGHRLPPGACGEYCVAGDQPARGYLGLPEKTAEVFVEYKGMRMYHTGDVVRYRENGDVEFVGRKDGMVKIRGFRIELKEVEAAIRPFEGIKDVTVQAYDYDGGGKYLAAFVVADKQINTEDLLAFVKSQKPPYMVPAIVMQIDKIPLTVNQKVDKKALPKPQMAAAAFVAPKNKIEEDFCQIFAEVLGQEKVSATSDFFEIGGSSIIALKVVIAADKRGYTIVYNDVFTYTTAQDMAEYLGAAQCETEDESRTENHSTYNEECLGEASVYGANTTEIAPDGYDYRAINELLRGNTMEAFKNGETQPIGDVLLTGATGYLGIHVLKDLIDNYTGKVYCFVRVKGPVSAENRLKHLLFYYFDNEYNDLFQSSGNSDARLFIIEGDATDSKCLDGFSRTGITVINCAACVKHFSKGNEIEEINVGSVRNLVAWCIKSGSRLIHVSTGSVMGTSVDNMPPKGFRFNERMLYVGQSTEDNQYTHSKFMAERLIYEAMLTQGLNAKVMRVGNLAPRDKDGEFQINFKSNNFTATLAAYGALGVIPYEGMDAHVEFSPIDKVARAIMLLSTTPRECVCFMPSNQHRPMMGDIVMQLKPLGYPMRMVEAYDFKKAVQAALNNPDRVDKMRPLMAYNSSLSKNSIRRLGYDDLDVGYTVQVLYRHGFRWPVTSVDYVRRFLTVLSGFDFFE